MIRKSYRLQPLAAACSATFLLASLGFDAQALSLGKISVLSALGEPLRAEIDIPEISADEAASLKVGPASPDAFKAAGLDYNNVVNNLTITLQKRPDGRSFLRLSSDRVVNDPFLDLILESNWSSGRIVRDYTMLFDPPGLRAPALVQPSAAQIAPQAPSPTSAPVTAPAIAPAAAATRPTAPVAPSGIASPTRPPVSVAPAPTSAPQAKPPATATPVNAAKQVVVAKGDTAGKIAASVKPASLSLDQMLVALLRSNPDAFIGGNVNRLRAGAVLDIPDPATAGSMTAGEAKQNIIAQSKDFNEFRRKLAQAAPGTQVAAADRTVSGSISAQVQEKKSAAISPDKLTLSKGSPQSKAAEEKLAKDRQAKEAADRASELSKNIKDLGKISAAASAASAPATAPAAAAASAAKTGTAGIAVATGPTTPASASASTPVVKPAAPAASVAASMASAAVSVPASAASKAASEAPAAVAPVSAVVPASTATAVAAASVPATVTATAAVPASSTPTAAASAPTPAVATASAAAPVKTAAPVPAPPPESSLLDDLLEQPWIPLGVLAALGLGGFVFMRSRKRKGAAPIDSSFLESRLQPDSFFGASGGQRVDTSESSATGSSMVYSASQLDAAGDVDPVAEADVYLAYGRDLQAEEILKEALRTNPSRVAIHGKLLQIYAKRGDRQGFGQVATDAYKLTRGKGTDWNQICLLGSEIDPGNPMYQASGQPGVGGVTFDPDATAAAPSFAASTTPQPIEPAYTPASDSVDLDLDLDFSIGDDSPANSPNYSATQPMQATPVPHDNSATVALQVPDEPTLDIDFGSATVALNAPSQAPTPVQLSVPDIAMSDNGLTFTPEPPSPPPSATPAPEGPAPASNDFGMMEFDLGSLSLDLGTGGDTSSGATASASMAEAPIDADDPLATKLALAEEFNAIGDPDGARSLTEEVVAEATGALKEKAKRFLAEIG